MELSGPHSPDRRSRAGAPLRRRQLLAAGGAGALGLAVAGCAGEGGSDGEAGDGGADRDARAAGAEPAAMLAGLMALERRAVATYEEGARFSGGEVKALLLGLGEQSLAHVRALEALITGAGGEVPALDAGGIGSFVRDADSAVRAAVANGRRLVRAYTEGITASESAGLRGELLPMLANDAQHLVMLGGAPASSATPGRLSG